MRLVWLVEAVIIALYWVFFKSAEFPGPLDVVKSFDGLAKEHNLLGEVWSSIKLFLSATCISTLIALFVCYLGQLPAAGILSWATGKTRFLSLFGIQFFFMGTFSGYDFKLALLVFGQAGFMVVSMQNVLNSITSIERNHARTMGLGPWEELWQVDIRSRLHEIPKVISDNTAISLVMLAAVEGLVRSEGGIGVVMLTQNKRFDLDAVIMLQFIVLSIGVSLDWFTSFVRSLIPYANLTKASK